MRHRVIPLFLAAMLPVGISGCLAPPPDVEGIGFREARFRDVQAMRDWRACRDEGLALDQQAAQSVAPARYLVAARVLESCESALGPEASALAPEERMRAYALAVQDRLKGGDLAGARAGLDRFRAAFPDRDLYFDDGTSFLDTIEALLAAGSGHPAPGGTNLSGSVEDELRRLARWRRG